MFLSKIWFVLVGLLAGVALTAAFVAPRPADRRIEQLEGQRLDRAQYAAEQMLKTDAHRWIDYVAKVGRDAVLADALDSATRGAGEARMLHETVRNRLKALIPDLVTIAQRERVAVYGVARERRGRGPLRKLAARVFYWSCRRLFDVPIEPQSTHFRVLARQAVNAIVEIKDNDRHLRVSRHYTTSVLAKRPHAG